MNVVTQATLGEVADINPTFKSSGITSDELVDFLPMAAVDEEKSVALPTEYRELKEVQKGYTSFNDGDVLLAKITPCFENGKIAQVRLRQRCGFGSTEFHVLRPHADKLDGRYLVHFLRRGQVRIDGERKMTGSAGQRRVPNYFLDSLPIPLPPLPEQRRIAAILDQADALRAKRREALAQLDSLTQSIFIEMFGEGNDYPEQTLDELCELITDGTHQTPTYAEEGFLFLSAKNVTTGKIDWSNVKFIPAWLHDELHKRLAPRRNDILLAKNGTTGVSAIVDRDCMFDIYVSLALLRPKQGILATYLHAAINSPICKKQFNGALKGIGVPNLHLKDIRSTKVPNPPLKVQQEFAGRIAALEHVRKLNTSSFSELDSLFATLQHRAFRGEL